MASGGRRHAHARRVRRVRLGRHRVAHVRRVVVDRRELPYEHLRTRVVGLRREAPAALARALARLLVLRVEHHLAHAAQHVDLASMRYVVRRQVHVLLQVRCVGRRVEALLDGAGAAEGARKGRRVRVADRLAVPAGALRIDLLFEREKEENVALESAQKCSHQRKKIYLRETKWKKIHTLNIFWYCFEVHSKAVLSMPSSILSSWSMNRFVCFIE